MNILAIDTATEACSVAILSDGSCNEIFEVIPRQHTERVLPMVDELLNNSSLSLSDLDAIAFNCGPGSFTGVRVGTSVTQGLAFSQALPVIPVSSLAALAQQAYRLENKQQVLSAIDARMNEVYWAAYHLVDGMMELAGTEQVSVVENIQLEGNYHCLGSGWDTYHAEIENLPLLNVTSSSADRLPSAQDVAILAQDYFRKNLILNAEQAIPSYIRDEVSWKKISEQ